MKNAKIIFTPVTNYSAKLGQEVVVFINEKQKRTVIKYLLSGEPLTNDSGKTTPFIGTIAELTNFEALVQLPKKHLSFWHCYKKDDYFGADGYAGRLYYYAKITGKHICSKCKKNKVFYKGTLCKKCNDKAYI